MVLERNIDSFLGQLDCGFSFFQQAGEKLVRLLDEDPRVFDKIMERKHAPWITTDVLSTIEAIGRKQIAPEALMLPRHILTRLSGLPVDEQLRLLDGPVEVVVGRQGGHHVTERKKIGSLNRAEAARVIGPRSVRTPDQQSALMQKPKPVSAGIFKVTVMNGKIFVNRVGNSEKPELSLHLKTGTGLVEIFTE